MMIQYVQSVVRSVGLAATMVMGGLWIIGPGEARGQCGPSIVARHGGEASAVEQVSAGVLLVGHGTVVDLVNVSNPASPAYVSTTAAHITLESPAVKIAMTPGSGRAFVLQASGNIAELSVTATTLSRGDTIIGDYKDIAADGARVLAVEYPLNVHNGGGSGHLDIIETTGVLQNYLATVAPTNSGYRYDKIVKVGNVAWIGFHLDGTQVLGVDGIDVTNPAAPVRVTTSLNTSLTTSPTGVTAMAGSGTRLYVAFKNNSSMIEDWMRVVDVTTPGTPSWRPAVDLNSLAEDITVTGTQVHVSVGAAGVSVWDAANASAMAWQGTYVVQGASAHDAFAVSGTDYVAAGSGGLVLLNTTTPASMSVRSLLDELTSRAVVVRQAVNTTVVLDTAWSYLRLFDYTQPEGSQSRGIAFVGSGDDLLEIAVLPSGRYACVTGGSTLRVIDINNTASPTVLTTFNLGSSVRMLSVFGSKAYTWDENSTLKVIDLANPSSPVVRSSTTYGGNAANYTALASWNNTVALGTSALGVWLIDATNAAAPSVQAVWNPGNSYSVGALCKGPTNLFVGATTGSGTTLRSRLETLDITTLSTPTLAWGLDDAVGGNPPRIDALMYVANATNHFLVATRAAGSSVPVAGTLTFFDLSNAQVPVPIGAMDAWDVRSGGPVASADGNRLIVGGNEGGVYEIAVPTQWAPGFVSQPVDRHGCLGGSVLFALNFPPVVASPSTGVTFRWYRNGVPMSDGPTGWGSTVSGSSGTFLTISGLHPMDGNGASYECAATNSCGARFTRDVHVLMCAPDFNCSGTLTVQDIFDFLNAWFAGTATANFNGVNGLGVQDIFDFLNAWFAGCS